jgi:hypothetical protein
VNGKRWKNFDKQKEIIHLEGLAGTATIQANY